MAMDDNNKSSRSRDAQRATIALEQLTHERDQLFEAEELLTAAIAINVANYITENSEEPS